jgi:hypothetical protein
MFPQLSRMSENSLDLGVNSARPVFGQAVFELLDAGGEPDRAFVGGGQVCL